MLVCSRSRVQTTIANMVAAGAENDADNNIWIACSDGNIDDVRRFLDKGVSVNAKDENGYNPLQAAASYGLLDLTRLLLEKGANVNITDADGDTPLHVCETVECAQLLLEKGANLNALNGSGQLAHEVAGEDGRYDVENYLRQLAGLPPAEPRKDLDEILAEQMEAIEAGQAGADDDEWEDID